MYERAREEEHRRNVVAIAASAFAENRRASAFNVDLDIGLRPRANTGTFGTSDFLDPAHLNILQFTSTRRASYQVQMDLMHSRVDNELAAIENQLDPHVLKGKKKAPLNCCEVNTPASAILTV